MCERMRVQVRVCTLVYVYMTMYVYTYIIYVYLHFIFNPSYRHSLSRYLINVTSCNRRSFVPLERRIRCSQFARRNLQKKYLYK